MTDNTYCTNDKNLLIQTAPIGNYILETKVEFEPYQNWQYAGLRIYLNDNNWLQISRAYCQPSLPSCVGDGVYFDYFLNGNLVEPGEEKQNVPIPTGYPSVYLRITRQNSIYSGDMSLDGTTWNKVGERTLSYSPTWIGLTASNQTLGDDQIPANFDYFMIVDYSYHIYMPFVEK